MSMPENVSITLWISIQICLLGLICLSAQAQPNTTGLQEHPCVLVNSDMLPVIRAAAADATPNRFGFNTAEIWQELLAQADAFLVAEPYHYEVNIPLGEGKTAPWSYTLSDETPPPHDDTPSYPPWTAMTQEQRDDAITVRLKALSAAYLVTGERKYADRAKTIAMHLTHWAAWSDPSYTAGAVKACLDTGHLTKCMALFYDWCYDTLSEDERAAIRTAIIEKGMAAIETDVDRYAPETNGYAVLTAGLACAAIALRPEDPTVAQNLTNALEYTKHSLDLCGSDGGMFEGPGYGTYLLDSFAHVFDAVTAANIETDLFEHPFLATMPYYTISHTTPVGGVMPCFSDGSPSRGYPETMSVLALRGSTDAAWYLEQIDAIRPRTLHQFLRFDADRINPVQPSFNPSLPFVDIGYAILRDGYNQNAPYLAFKSGPFDNNIGHNHFDHNSFVISYNGDWLVTDRGYHYRYDPAMRKFSLGTMGHASMVMDIDDGYMNQTDVPAPGHDQVSRAGGHIEKFYSSPIIDMVQGQAAKAYNSDDTHVLDDFTRSIFYFKPNFFVMVDHVAAPEAHSYNFTLQADAMSVYEQAEQEDANGEMTTNHWNLLSRSTEMGCWMYSPEGISTQAFLYPGAEKYGQVLRAITEPVEEATLITVMQPRKADGSTLIRNAGFEADISGWQPRANEDLPNHVADPEVSHSGKASGRIDRSGYYYGPKVAIDAGTAVNASVWVRTENTPVPKAYLAFHFFNSAGKCFKTVATEYFAGEEWTQLSLDAVAPEDTDTVCIGLYYSGPGAAWFDDVTFEAVAEDGDDGAPAPVEPLIATPIEDGARGVEIELGSDRYTLITAGQPVDAAGMEIYHDGAFAAIANTANGEAIYIQEGTHISANGETLLSAGDEPATVSAFLDNDKVLHVTMADSVEPHAPLRAPADVRLTIRGIAKLSKAMCGDTELTVTQDGPQTWIIGG